VYIVTYNRHVKFGLKIPNRLEKNVRKLQGRGYFFDSHCGALYGSSLNVHSQHILFHSNLQPHIPKSEAFYLCPERHSWWKFGENLSSTFQVIMLTMKNKTRIKKHFSNRF